MVYNDDLPVIMVNDKVVCKIRVIESDIKNELIKLLSHNQS